MNNQEETLMFAKSLMDELESVVSHDKQLLNELLNKKMTAGYDDGGSLLKVILWPSEIRGYQLAIKTVSEFIKSFEECGYERD